MKLIITIDTEEDNWGSYGHRSYTLENITCVPALQRLFDEFNLKPTYLVTYPIATNPSAVSILKEILEAGKCEIGAHCHPWNTPPFEEPNTPRNSMLCNLPVDLQYTKMSVLHHVIQTNFNIEPVSFRSGRWGFNHEVARNLQRLGYKVDTSITPYTDWTNYHGPDFSRISPHPYKFCVENIYERSPNGDLLEIPATIGFLQRNSARSNAILSMVGKKPMNRLNLVGILSRLKLLNKIWLSPEVSSAASMIRLTRRMMKGKHSLVNMVLHSSSLIHGLNPFVRTKEDEIRLLERMKAFFTFARKNCMKSISLSNDLSIGD